MNLASVVEDYVTLKRSTGLRFTNAATILKAFARAAGPIDVNEVAQETVQTFLHGSRQISSTWHLKHYTLVGLFRFAMQRGLVSTSPVPYLVPKRPAYAKPYIYSTDELRRLLDATEALDLRHPQTGRIASVSALTFRTLILLLYGAGLRLSEALALTVDDVDLSANLLVVRITKFFKTRLLPIGPQLSLALGLYAEKRLALVDRGPQEAPSCSGGVGQRSLATPRSTTSGSSAAGSGSSARTAPTFSRVSMTSGTPSPCTGLWPGIARGRTFSFCCRGSRPIWVTSAWPRRSTI